jgi:hypothetical protein
MAITANNTTLTFNDASTQTTSAVTAVNVGTGISSSGGKTPTLTNTGVTSIVAGTGISISGGTGAVTITNSQPGAVSSVNGQTGAVVTTSVDSIGSTTISWYAITIPANTSGSFNAGDTVAGSTLRYNTSITSPFNSTSAGGATNSGNQPRPWPEGGSTYSGTYRCMQKGSSYGNSFDSESNRSIAAWNSTIWVRVS